MLNIRNTNQNIYLKDLIFQEDGSSDREFYYNKILNLGVNISINDIVDNEVSEISANYNTINFNIFFLKHVLDTEITEISKYIEEEFLPHINETKLAFGLIDELGNPLPKYVNNPFEYRQPSGILEPTLRSDEYSKKQNIDQLIPYFLNSQNIKPRISGYPIFYNTFTFPYWNKNDQWVNDKLLYLNKSFFGFSFILLELYDSPDPLTQNKIGNVPIFNNKRYCLNEKPLNYNDLMLRPSYTLSDGDEGFSFMLSKKTNLNEVYVKFSYWDALNNNQINLLPSFENYGNITNLLLSKKTTSGPYTKKWIQNINAFKNNSRYLRYSINRNTMRYRMFEYNSLTNNYDIEKNNYDLYELFFDDFWTNTPVVNKKPKNYTVTQAVNDTVLNPFEFNISKISGVNELNKLNLDTDKTYPKLQVYNNNLQEIIDHFFDYVYNFEVKKFELINVKSEQYDIPLINRYIYGVGGNVTKFKATNITDQNVKITNIQIDDMVIFTDKYILNNSINILSKTQDPFAKEKIMVNETLTVNSINNEIQSPDKLLIDIFIYNKLLYKLLYFHFIEQENPNQYIPFFYTNKENFVSKLYGLLKLFNINEKWDNLKQNKDLRFEVLDIIHNKLTELETANNYEELYSIYNYFISEYQTDKIGVGNLISVIDVDRVNSMSSYPKKMVDNTTIFLLQQQNLTLDEAALYKNITIDELLNNLNNDNYNPIPALLFGINIEKTYNVRNFLIDTIVTLKVNSGFTIKPNETFTMSLDFVLGDKIKQYISGKSFSVRGKIRLTIEHDGDIKNIFIPMNFTYNIKT